ncbi:MAG: hypothetical protein FWG65_04715 [Turicibacter sp.]|nr:hypothetical protein [Turicibacter sp.]
MNSPPLARGSYVFVTMLMTMLFLLAVTIVGITARGRTISSRYIYSAGLYDMAISAGGRVLHILQEHEFILELEEIEEEDLIYLDGQFLLVLSDEILQRFVDERNEAIVEFLLESPFFTNDGAAHSLTYSLNLPTGNMIVDAAISLNGNDFLVTSTAATAFEVNLHGRIAWPTLDIVVIPTAYTWRTLRPYDLADEITDEMLFFAEHEDIKAYFDSLGITAFHLGDADDVEEVLRYVRIEQFELEIGDYVPTLIMQRVNN